MLKEETNNETGDLEQQEIDEWKNPESTGTSSDQQGQQSQNQNHLAANNSGGEKLIQKSQQVLRDFFENAGLKKKEFNLEYLQMKCYELGCESLVPALSEEFRQQ